MTRGGTSGTEPMSREREAVTDSMPKKLTARNVSRRITSPPLMHISGLQNMPDAGLAPKHLHPSLVKNPSSVVQPLDSGPIAPVFHQTRNRLAASPSGVHLIGEQILHHQRVHTVRKRRQERIPDVPRISSSSQKRHRTTRRTWRRPSRSRTKRLQMS